MDLPIYNYLRRNRTVFTSKEFAERIGIAPSNFSKVANGHSIPSVSLAKRIEKATNGDLKWHDLIDDAEKALELKKKKKIDRKASNT